MRATGMRRIVFAAGLICACMLGITAPQALADENDFDVYASFERFTWEEFDTAGTKLLKEHGPRSGIGFAYHGTFGEKGTGLTVQPRIEFNGGTVDYDGQGCDIYGNCVPLTTDTGYFGTKVEVDLGGRFGGGNVFAEPFVGLGVRSWWRDIKDTWIALGYTEHWQTVYGRLGLRGDVKLTEASKLFFEAVAKLPLKNQNTAYLSDLGYSDDPVMRPGKETAFAAEAGWKFHVLKLSVFYDSMRFKKSDPVIVYDYISDAVVLVWQPRSEAEIYGFKIGASF